MGTSTAKFLGELDQEAEEILKDASFSSSCCVAVPKRWLEQIREGIAALEPSGDRHE